MGNWYVMRTVPNEEEHAVELMQRVLTQDLWIQCRILKKQKLFRSGGQLLLQTEILFPGYIFIQTNTPCELQEELNKAKQFPKLIGNQSRYIVSVEDEELRFLKSICGENLQYDMGLSRVQVDDDGNLIKTEGVLQPYMSMITRQRLRKRYVLASVTLFNRKEDILFGVFLSGDQIVRA